MFLNYPKYSLCDILYINQSTFKSQAYQSKEVNSAEIWREEERR